MRCYSELILLPTFGERLEYLRLEGTVGRETFGGLRYLNQNLYHNDYEWKEIRRHIILRDGGNDLGVEGYPIMSRGSIHHINPITAEDIVNRRPCLFDPENLILVSMRTHNEIHYSHGPVTTGIPVVRRRNDQCPWLD